MCTTFIKLPSCVVQLVKSEQTQLERKVPIFTNFYSGKMNKHCLLNGYHRRTYLILEGH